VDFRVAEEAPAEIRPTKIEIVDFRNDDRPASVLLAAFNFPHLIWAEAAHKAETGGADRTALTHANTLVLWTTPPTPSDLRSALAAVRPQRVILVCRDPGADEPHTFLTRLAGLAKFAINQRGGLASVTTLAAATAQSEAAVLAGLDWLSKRGQVSVQVEADGTVRLGLDGATADEAAASRVMSRIQFLLKESAAYRAHLRRANAQSILQ
jgi:hypothetical protein